jgi:hypothetical protein
MFMLSQLTKLYSRHLAFPKSSSSTMFLLHTVSFALLLPLLSSAIPAPALNSAPSTWQHPGYVVSKSQLDFAKAQVQGKAQPWTAAYNKMLEDSDKYGKYATATRKSKATATVKCGPTTKPDIGCTDERGDALAAWANALAGYVSGDTTFTNNSVTIMNKWSHTIKGTRIHLLSHLATPNSSYRTRSTKRHPTDCLGRRFMGENRRTCQTYIFRSMG